MPRYYFRMDSDDSDDEGIELADDEMARGAARDLFGQAIREGEVRDGGNLIVRDAKGRQVARLSFSAEE